MQAKKQKLNKILAKIIKKYRQNTKKSLNIFANDTDISPSTLSDIENCKSDPQFSTLWRVAEALDLPLSKIVEEIEKELKNKKLFLD